MKQRSGGTPAPFLRSRKTPAAAEQLPSKGVEQMLTSKATLVELLAFHYDRRDRVLNFLADTVRPDDVVRPMKAGWSSMRETMLHGMEAEVFWVGYAMQQGEQPNWDYAAYPDVASLKALAASVRADTERFVAALTDADLARDAAITYSSGSTFSFPLSKGFLHMILHDTHHRGQVMLLARQLGYEPPEIDLM